MNDALQLPKFASLEEAAPFMIDQLRKIQQLSWRVKQLEKELYGSSSERKAQSSFSSEQILLTLFTPAQPPLVQQALCPPEEPKSAAKPRRQPAAKELETRTQRLEPQEKTCPQCGRAKEEIGCEVSERFEYVPAKIIRHQIIRPKLACACKQSGVSIAPLPPALVDQGMPGPGLMSHVLLSKFADHIPLHRQQQQFARLGVNFPKSTLGDWVEKGALWLQPLAQEMKRELARGDYVQVDETPVRVQDPDTPGRCATGWLWVMSRPAGDVVFEFHPGRGKEFALQLLDGFAGYLQRDGYGVYASVARGNPKIIPVGCWAHARRKFVEAIEDGPPEALEIVDQLRQLYLLERRARDQNLAPAQRKALRQQNALPILEALHPRLQTLQTQCLPQSPLGKAINYTLAEWKALTCYLEDGRLEVDNNLTENAIRPSAVGKKNWLFIGHPEAGWRSAVVYTMIVSCQRRAIDPWEYLSDVLRRLPGTKQSDLSTLLPANWKPAAADL